MKKTYKTFNGENRNCLFKVGKELVTAAFTPTFSTDDISLQRAIEDSQSFNVGKLQLVTPPMQWIKIDRDENGFATEEHLRKIEECYENNIPVVIAYENYLQDYEVITPCSRINAWLANIKRGKVNTHYMVLPKAPEE